jgi:dGTPase
MKVVRPAFPIMPEIRNDQTTQDVLDQNELTFVQGLGISPRQGTAPEAQPTDQDPFVFNGRLPLYPYRLRPSTIKRDWHSEDFHSDKSRIVFCSSFRRMMQKAQVFSLESNTSVRNRLTHSLEVADIGRTLTRKIGKRLEKAGIASPEENECMQCIVESACLLHDIGNPPFGHFGEEAIKRWFQNQGAQLFGKKRKQLELGLGTSPQLFDFQMFDGNPQGFRIATKLHCDVDLFGLNLTCSTLLASIKYPNCGSILPGALFGKKIGIFASERNAYHRICQLSSFEPGRRYFLAYLMELADDICYCLSDIADSFEKRLISSRDFKEEFRKICEAQNVDSDTILPKEPIASFPYQVSIKVATRLMNEASIYFAEHIDSKGTF